MEYNHFGIILKSNNFGITLNSNHIGIQSFCYHIILVVKDLNSLSLVSSKSNFQFQVTVDGPREPRTKSRFFPGVFGPIGLLGQNPWIDQAYLQHWEYMFRPDLAAAAAAAATTLEADTEEWAAGGGASDL